MFDNDGSHSWDKVRIEGTQGTQGTQKDLCLPDRRSQDLSAPLERIPTSSWLLGIRSGGGRLAPISGFSFLLPQTELGHAETSVVSLLCDCSSSKRCI